MTGMTRYYLSRAAVSMALATLMTLAGLAWWFGAVAGAAAFGFFLWAPRSGRYVVYSGAGRTNVRRDERTEQITGQAARASLGVTLVAMAALAMYFGLFAQADVPVLALNVLLILAAATYFIVDFRLRRL